MSRPDASATHRPDARQAGPPAAASGRLGGAVEAARARWLEWRALLSWIVHSWRRPPDADARWEQRADRSWWQ